jgi:hypothetical protein
MSGPGDGAFSQYGSAGIPFAAITDGLSNTLMVGEKHVALGRFGHGWLDSSLYNGNYPVASTRPAGPGFPLATSLTDETVLQSWVFGSYHPGICQFVFCDGSVRPLPVSIDPSVLGLLARRNDGEVIPAW